VYLKNLTETARVTITFASAIRRIRIESLQELPLMRLLNYQAHTEEPHEHWF